ncbi:Dipeptidyl peptidase IV (DPP IV) N-terminal region [Chitinophaga sp. CF118]|uniref:S9 family peptidase n=1 Tax=Chitinophaga sp. CF118 TaxID=1884367 RepID=UPI0008F36744|nr:S9 family peptidase [Chitinophaga sp. CF118]SFD57404.1 Dipeptidyl peptidase IV (DPP IV) N-terminal region [Chitinophaga sp. CF118]
MKRRRLLLLGCLFANMQLLHAQSLLPAYRPSQEEEKQAYRNAALLDSTIRNKAYKTTVKARWQNGEAGFWYKNILADSTSEFMFTDVLKASKRPAFDHKKMAEALSAVMDTTLHSNKLPITDLVFPKKGNALLVEVKGKWYSCNLLNYTCTPAATPLLSSDNGSFIRHSRWEYHDDSTVGDSLSPNKEWTAFIRDGNVFVKAAGTNDEFSFTTDGTKEKPYGALKWSPDSKYLVGYHINPVTIQPVYHLLSSLSNSTRAKLDTEEYAQPGDPFTGFEMFVFNLADKKMGKVNTEIYDFLGRPYLRWRKSDPRYFTFEKADRGHQRFRVIEVDALTGNTRNIIDEKTNTFIYEQQIFTHYLDDTNEMIWSSEKDGWNRLYLVDVLKGTVKNEITTGSWVVRGIDSVDEKKREIWFRGSGMNSGEDPYNIHYYRINFDGTHLVKLTTANAQHTLSFSPGKTYYLDTYSRPDLPPVTELHRTTDGKLLMEVERADLKDYLAMGMRFPEVFHSKARDGQTDIWGVVCRPRNFDSTRRYPVIENIYAGPQDAFVPKTFMTYGEMQSMAELGFIVVQIDGMGTANRSKAFHDMCWHNLADAGLPDRILWIKALAAKYPYIDTTRVGLYGTSAGGQNAAGALLFHPEFYKAAVSACGCHDNRVDKQWWNEQWMGYPVGPHYEAQSNVTNASKLQGKLLLIVGENDHNVPPESTYRVVDALIKANKDFDLLVVPGMDHSDGGPYGRKKKRDFFVRNLLGVEPPERNKE